MRLLDPERRDGEGFPAQTGQRGTVRSRKDQRLGVKVFRLKEKGWGGFWAQKEQEVVVPKS